MHYEEIGVYYLGPDMGCVVHPLPEISRHRELGNVHLRDEQTGYAHRPAGHGPEPEPHREAGLPTPWRIQGGTGEFGALLIAF